MAVSWTPIEQDSPGRSAPLNANFQALANAIDGFPDAESLANGTFTYGGDDTGTANAYVVTLDPVPASYVEGMTVKFKATNANTGAATLNVNGLGVKTIRAFDGEELVAGQIPAGGIVECLYDGTVFRLNNVVGVNVPADGSVTLAKHADLAEARVLGRASGAATGAVTALTPDQVGTLLLESVTHANPVRQAFYWEDDTEFSTGAQSPSYSVLMTGKTVTPVSANSSLYIHITGRVRLSNGNGLGSDVGAYVTLRHFDGTSYIAGTIRSVIATNFQNNAAVDGTYAQTIKLPAEKRRSDTGDWTFALYGTNVYVGCTMVFKEVEIIAYEIED